MPTVIPYSSALTLCNVVDPNLLQNLIAISEAQAPIDAAQDTLNSFISLKRSLDMTVQELINMGVDATELIRESQEAGKQITEAASNYGKIRLDQEKKIQELKGKVSLLSADIESPVDYNRTQIKKMPLAADSIKLDSQYFSFDENEQSAQNTVASIKGFVSESVSYLGNDFASQVSSSAATQINKQRQNHEVAGTLIITATCTHKDALLLAPFVLDVDKAIRVWNSLYKDPADKIKTNDVENMASISMKEGTDKEKMLTILSGATYGSCFVGMVHILRTETTQSSQQMVAVAESMRETFSVGGWFAKGTGSFGVDSSFANDVKNLLSTQNITSHITVISMGCIPSIKSNAVKIGVKEFANFDPKDMMNNLATFNDQSTSMGTVDSDASEAKAGAQMLAIHSSTVKDVMLSLQQIDDGENKMLDINSLMTAFEDYIDKAIAGDVGVPINYYLKNITAAQLAQMWMAKYYPGKYLEISGDDSKTTSS